MRVKGQRIKTCLVYLNAEFEGGETEFPKLGLKYRGRAGDAGLPPTRGEKWLFSQWMRSKAQPIA